MEMLVVILVVVIIVLLICMNYYCNRYEQENKINKSNMDRIRDLEDERNSYKKVSIDLNTELKNNKEKNASEIEKLNQELKETNKKLKEINKNYKDLSKEYKELKKENDEMKKTAILFDDKPIKTSTEELFLKSKTVEDKEEKKTIKRTRKTKKSKEEK